MQEGPDPFRELSPRELHSEIRVTRVLRGEQLLIGEVRERDPVGVDRTEQRRKPERVEVEPASREAVDPEGVAQFDQRERRTSGERRRTILTVGISATSLRSTLRNGFLR
jgi:hypothetical protein